MPTFKFKEGTPDYEFSRPKKLPSYTDRVIYKYSKVKNQGGKRGSSNKIIVEDYNSLAIHMSDHLPVLFIARVFRSSTKFHF